jgi:hypothetical protein
MPTARAPSPFPPKMDALSKFGAGLLCDAIAEFWSRRGFSVRAERFPVEGTASWGVRSNLVAGLPPQRRARA